MAGGAPSLHILDRSSAARELDLVTELFHRINRLIPASQKVLTAAPGDRARDVIAKMREHRYSQVPVVEKGHVLGVFSFRSFALEMAAATLDDLNRQRCAPGDLRVDECLEQFEFARVTDEMSRVFDFLERDNAVLVGAPERLLGILTPMDVLRYLYQVATPFVLISEIELALRALIRLAMPDEEISRFAGMLLEGAYSKKRVPARLEEMSFDNYRLLITHGETWPRFEGLLGGTPARASAKLRSIGEIRNAVFHFRQDVSVENHQSLAAYRNWILSKIKQAEMQTASERASRGEVR